MQIASLATAALLAWGCASAGAIRPVQTEYWKDENFAAYRRYAWLPSDAHRQEQTQAEDHRLHDLIREAIDERLAIRAFTQTDSSGADFLVTYHCKITEQLEAEVIDRVWYGDQEYSDWRKVTRRIELSTFDEGSIIIDFVKPATGKRVWRGVARGRVSSDATQEEYEDIVDRAVREVLDEFPPGRLDPT